MTVKLNTIQIPFKQDSTVSNCTSKKATNTQNTDNTKETGVNKLALSLSALGAIGAGVLAATIACKKGKVQGANTAIETAKDTITQALEKSKNIDLDIFKQIGGTFKDRKAIINNQPYTGSIYLKNAKGDNVVLTYQNGILESSKIGNTLKSYDGTKVTIKSGEQYTIVEKTAANSIIKKTKDGNTKIIEYIAPDGTITTRTVRKNSAGEIVSVEKSVCNGKEKTRIYTLGAKENSGQNYKKHEVVNGKKVTNEYSNDGTLVSSTTNEYNPKTGVLKITTKHTSRPPFRPEERHEVYLRHLGTNNSRESFLCGKLNQNGELESIYIAKNGEFIPEMLHGTQIFKDVKPVSLEEARALIKKYELPFEI